MHNTDITTDLQQIRIYAGDTLIFDGADPTTYTICETAEDIDALFAKIAADAHKPRRVRSRREPAFW